jgi:hypothetical protein
MRRPLVDKRHEVSEGGMRFNLKAVMLAVVPWAALVSMCWAKISQYPPEIGPYAEGLIFIGKASFCLAFTLVWFIGAWHAPAAVRWLRRHV